MESVIDFVTNGDVSDLSKLSSDDKLEDEIQMVTNMQEEYENESSNNEVNVRLSEIVIISSLFTTEAVKSQPGADKSLADGSSTSPNL